MNYYYINKENLTEDQINNLDKLKNKNLYSGLKIHGNHIFYKPNDEKNVIKDISKRVSMIEMFKIINTYFKESGLNDKLSEANRQIDSSESQSRVSNNLSKQILYELDWQKVF